MNAITRINKRRSGSLAVLPGGCGTIALHPVWEARAPPTARIMVTKHRIIVIVS